MSPLTIGPFQRAYRFPRVSGDEPFQALLTRTTGWFSPRERG